MTATLNQMCDGAERLFAQCLHTHPNSLPHIAALRDEVRQVRETYNLMLHSFLAGQQDKVAGDIYVGLCARTQAAIDRAAHLLHRGGTLPMPFDFGSHTVEQHFDLIIDGDVWTKGGAERARTWMREGATRTEAKLLMTSALTLALLQLFDPLKMHLLIDAWEEGEPCVKRRALVGLTLALRHCADRLPLHPDLSGRISLMMTETAFRKGVFLALRLLEQSRLTPGVSRKLGEDILPTIMRGGQLKNLSPKADEVDRSLTEQGENLEWFIPTDTDAAAQEKMREMAQMQLGGADIYWTTFQQIRQRMKPFFAQTANCLRPFDENVPFVRETLAQCSKREANLLLRLVKNAPFCDSDKFAFIAMLGMIGSDGRSALVQALQGQLDGEDIEESLSALSEGFHSEEALTRSYVWDLYRYWTMPERRASAGNENPFNDELPHFSPLEQDVFHPLLNDSDEVEALAQFFMRNKLYAPALALFKSMSHHGSPHTATRWQEMGFCLQKTGQGEAAYQAYKEAFNIDPQSQWTLKHLVELAGRQDKHIEAEAFCDMLLEDDPNNTKWLVAKARALFGRNLYAQAVPLLYKAVYLQEDDERVWSQLAQALTLAGQTDKALETLQRMPHQRLDKTDWAFLQATVYLAMHDFARARAVLCPVQSILGKDFRDRLNDMLNVLGPKRITTIQCDMFRDSLQDPSQ